MKQINRGKFLFRVGPILNDLTIFLRKRPMTKWLGILDESGMAAFVVCSNSRTEKLHHVLQNAQVTCNLEHQDEVLSERIRNLRFFGIEFSQFKLNNL